MDPEDVKRCKVELLSDDVLGWKFKPGPGCEEVFEEIAKKQGPHAKKYLDVRKQPSETDEGQDFRARAKPSITP